MNQPHSVETVARKMVAFGAKPEIVARNFRSQAQTMRNYAEKASASRNGMHRGYSAAQALNLAQEADARAESVPAAMLLFSSTDPDTIAEACVTIYWVEAQPVERNDDDDAFYVLNTNIKRIEADADKPLPLLRYALGIYAQVTA